MRDGCRLDSDFYFRCLQHLAEVRGLDFVVPHSLPIPYFGDLKRYLKSPLRVLTAALNPSGREFPEDPPRFDVSSGLRGPAELETELTAYFWRNPYRSWFSSFEPVLNGLEASYGGKMAVRDYSSTALHVDMCSPIATSPTWSKLGPEQRGELTMAGRGTFEWLADELKPHIIMASVGWSHLNWWKSEFEDGRNWEACLRYDHTKDGKSLRSPLLVQMKPLQTKSGHKYLFANASAANTPFGRFSNERKEKAGQVLAYELKTRLALNTTL